MSHPAAAADRGGGYHAALDLLRGLCSVGVMLYHWMAWRLEIQVLSMGTFGVYIFFTLSAIVMVLSYDRLFGERITRNDLATFCRNRAARLLPLLFVAALAMLLFYLCTQGWGAALATLDETLLTGTGLMALTPPGYVSTIGGGWSLGIEIAFYAVAPLAILFAHSARRSSLLLVVGVLVVAQQLYILSISTVIDPLQHWRLYTMPVTFAPFFAIGFLISRSDGARNVAFLPAMLVLLAATFGASLLLPGDLMRAHAAFLLLTLISSAAVYCAYRTALPRWAVQPALLLGRMSYALYLLHMVMFNLNTIAAHHFGLSDAVRNLLDLAGPPIVALACYYWFERPLRARLRGSEPRELGSSLP